MSESIIVEDDGLGNQDSFEATIDKFIEDENSHSFVRFISHGFGESKKEAIDNLKSVLQKAAGFLIDVSGYEK